MLDNVRGNVGDNMNIKLITFFDDSTQKKPRADPME